MKELEKAVLAVMLGKKEEKLDETVKHPNQQKLDVHEPEKDELTAKDFEMLRAGKKAKEVKEGSVDKAHYCATHVEHSLHGQGTCISEAHADPDEDGNIAWYTVEFADGIKKVDTAALKILQAESHMHGKKKMRESAEEVEEEVDETIVFKPFDIDLKESYTFGEYLKAAKNIVGEEQAIELANEAFRLQDKSIFAEEVTRMDIQDRIKTHQNAGHKVSMPKYSTRDGKLHAEYVVTDKESGVRRKYIHHGNMRSVENMGARGKKDE